MSENELNNTFVGSIDKAGNKRQFIRQELRRKLESISTPAPVTLLLGTYNVNDTPPSGDLSEWLSEEKCSRADIVVIGLQEMDLSTDSFIISTAYEESKESQWLYAFLQTLKAFRCVQIKRLVGMCIFLFARAELMQSVKPLGGCSVASGLMGVVGNKGAVAVRFRLHNHKYIIICSHLAAHAQNYARRNYDYADITKRICFPPVSDIDNATSLEEEVLWDSGLADIKDCDFCFWMGDLNYRIDLESTFVRQCVTNKAYEVLHEADQLQRARTLGDAFTEYLEARVLFPPTFKYDIGSDVYDTSEKFRTPSWTDRILWRHNDRVEPVAYWCGMNVRGSDHRPVGLLCQVRSAMVDKERLQKLYEETLKRMDFMENAAIPHTSLNRSQVDMGMLCFGAQREFEVVLKNEGASTAQFEFITGLRDRVCESWITPHPLCGYISAGTLCSVLIFVGSSQVIKLTVNVQGEAAFRFNQGRAVEDILILHVDGGRDHFISLTGGFRPSVFARPLIDLPLSHNVVLPFQHILDALSTMTPNKLQFFELGDPHLLDKIIEQLDCGQKLAFDLRYSPECIAITLSQILLMFLDALPESLIPTSFYPTCIAVAYEGRAACMHIIERLPMANKEMLSELVRYMQRHCAACQIQGPELTYLARIISAVLIKKYSGYKRGKGEEESSGKFKAKAKFIKHLIGPDTTT